MKRKLTAVVLAGAFVLGGVSIAHADGPKVDQSACEVAAATRIQGIITEAIGDVKKGQAEGVADLKRARYLTGRIESTCEPGEGTQGGDGGHDGGDE